MLNKVTHHDAAIEAAAKVSGETSCEVPLPLECTRWKDFEQTCLK